MLTLRNKKSKMALAIGVLLVGLSVSSLYAKSKHDGACSAMSERGGEHMQMMPEMGEGAMMPSHFMHRFLGDLNLSRDQEDKVFAIFHNQKPQLYENHKIIQDNFKALRELRGQPFDKVKVETLTQAIGNAMAANIGLRAQAESAVYQILNAEQRKKWDMIQKTRAMPMMSAKPLHQ